MKRSSSRRRKRRSRTSLVQDAMGGSPAMTTDHGVVSHRQGLFEPHRRQGPTLCITNQAAYNNATLAAEARGSTDNDDEPGPVIQTTKTKVREVQIGPGITLGYLSLRDYKFVTSLPVVEEQQH